MAISRYNNFRVVKETSNSMGRLETFPSIKTEDLAAIPHTIIKFKESDRLNNLAQTFLGSASYWWIICLMNDLDNPFSYKLLPGFLLKIPNDIEPVLNLIKRNKAAS